VNKSALRRLALELRQELSLTAYDRCDPFALAELYGVQVLRLSELDCPAKVRNHFRTVRSQVFSGALIPLSDGSTVIIENDGHAPERRVSTASHEMAHVVLEHPFAAALTDSTGCRVANRALETEAAELSGELLLPSDAAKRLALDGVSDEVAAERFGVSVDLARWRLNATGARKIAARAHAKRRR
jgi:Zn-dependent peptidase ImmA (M78 family)